MESLYIYLIFRTLQHFQECGKKLPWRTCRERNLNPFCWGLESGSTGGKNDKLSCPMLIFRPMSVYRGFIQLILSSLIRTLGCSFHLWPTGAVVVTSPEFDAQVSLYLRPVPSLRIHCNTRWKVGQCLNVPWCWWVWQAWRPCVPPSACVLWQAGNDGNRGAGNEWEPSPSAAPASLLHRDNSEQGGSHCSHATIDESVSLPVETMGGK